MAETAREIIGSESVRYNPALEGWKGSIRFEVEGTGTWRVDIDDGNVQVHEGGGDTDCYVRCSEEEFVRVAKGEQNLLTGWMQGRIDAGGDMALLQRLHGFIRSDQGPSGGAR